MHFRSDFKLISVYTYKASFIILDYLQTFTTKYAHSAQQTLYFLQAHFYITLTRYFSIVSFCLNKFISPENRNLELLYDLT